MVCIGEYMCRDAHVEVRGQPCGVVSLIPSMWVPEMKLRLSGLHRKHFTCKKISPAQE